MTPNLLIIDDDVDFIEDFVLLLRQNYDCHSVNTGSDGLKFIRKNNPDVVLLDLKLGHSTNGLEVLKDIQKIDENLPVIMITDYASIDTAVEAIRLGAFDYISKSPNMKELQVIINKSLRQRKIKFQTQSLQQEIKQGYFEMIGNSPAMLQLRERIKLSAQNLNTVLITGESGVGKEIVARQIYYQSDRNTKSFVPLNCAAIPRDLIESELFGHEKGSFTGAMSRKIGKFEIASDGILFFDEISELEQSSQVKLLRVLQEKEFERIGGNKLLETDAKIIAATNQNLEELVSKGLFREDLFYRLDVLPIHVPPLRKRKQDLPLLIEHFLKMICQEMKIPQKIFSGDAIDLYMKYDWPGNIRQLRNYITRELILSKDRIIRAETLEFKADKIVVNDNFLNVQIPETWNEMDNLRKEAADKASRSVEKLFLENLLEKFDGNISKAAEHVGINRTNFHKMMKRCKL